MTDWRKEYENWLTSPALTGAEKTELENIKDDDKEIESRFCMDLQFGTAGLRGIMGMGTNRMNIHVIRHATECFAMTILEDFGDNPSIAICFDCRKMSEDFAREAACVMAANGIKALLFDAMRPTPELSFAVRHHGCSAGLNITASHNPKEYNGYKVYWSDGAQLPPKQAERIAKKMASTDVFKSVKTMPYDEALSKGLIKLIGSETDSEFLENVMAQAINPDCVKKAEDFKMVYTPFHGAGARMIPEALRRLGIKNLYCEEKQMVPDGEFPTVKSPNPENPEGFYLSIELADKVGADFILGSDPDADRVGILVRGKDGTFVPITGNQTGALLLNYLIGAMKRKGTLPENAVALKTIVTTELTRSIAVKHGIKCYDTFTGFKFMAEKKNLLEEKGEGKVIFSYEESYGYMLGDYVRDKDAVSASLLLTEMAAYYHNLGKSLLDVLEELFSEFGCYEEKTINIIMPGLEGMARMADIMDTLRKNSPKSIAETDVISVRDYLTGEEKDLFTGEKTSIELSGSNVLSFDMADSTRLIIRPSGTEPKIKIYILAHDETKEGAHTAAEKYAVWADTIKEI